MLALLTGGQRLAFFAFVCCLCCWTPSEAAPRDAGSDARWSFSAIVGVLADAQYAQGESQNSFASSEFFASRVADDDVLVLTPVVPVGLEVDGPPITFVGKRWRPFVHGRVSFPTDGDRTIARQGSIPNPVVISDTFAANLSAGQIAGQGTLLKADFEIFGQTGLGFEVDLSRGTFPLFLRASLDYLVQKVRIEGSVVHVSGTGPDQLRPFSVQRLGAREDVLLHFLGPRLEVGTWVGEAGPFALGVFADVAGFASLGGRTESLSASDGAHIANFEFEAAPWVVQAGVGVKLRWRGWR